MPLYVYACRGCGNKVEKLTRSTLAHVPMVIGSSCPNCRANTKHDRVPTTAAIRTDSSSSSVRDSQRSSQRTSQERAARMNNIRKGLTGDGRVPNNLQEKSAREWGSAVSQAYPTLDSARQQIQEDRKLTK